jgi:predicted aspartyl protease
VISGIVIDRHAIVSIIFHTSFRSDLSIDFVIDTGFTDELCLPPEAVSLLGLPFKYAIPANLADNSRVLLPGCQFMKPLFYGMEKSGKLAY